MKAFAIGLMALMPLYAGFASGQTYDFKGIVAGGKSSIKSLETEHALTCHHAAQFSKELKAVCTGKTTILGQESQLRVSVDYQEIVRHIQVDYKRDPLRSREVFREMKSALSKKFGPPQSDSHDMTRWWNSKSHVMVLTDAKLEMRAGERKPKPGFSEKQRKDL